MSTYLRMVQTNVGAAVYQFLPLRCTRNKDLKKKELFGRMGPIQSKHDVKYPENVNEGGVCRPTLIAILIERNSPHIVSYRNIGLKSVLTSINRTVREDIFLTVQFEVHWKLCFPWCVILTFTCMCVYFGRQNLSTLPSSSTSAGQYTATGERHANRARKMPFGMAHEQDG